MSEAPRVTVQQGELQGRILTTSSGKPFYSFQGIPYAKPPLGSLRFKAPLPAEPWEGVRDATSEGNVSAQIDELKTKGYIGGEDCLFLNVYTPNLDGEFLPVMLNIHGGAFKMGSGNASDAGPAHLVDKDVVLVTINYRLGALGFLCLNTPEVPGNAAMKDMVQAIKWVKENIHNFGGNPGNLTILGQSAGAAAVSYLSVSPLSKDLISKGIMQSGNSLCKWAIQTEPIANARTLATELGNDSEDVDDILAFLQTVPVQELAEISYKLPFNETFVQSGEITFTPVVEKEFPDVEAFLTEPVLSLLTSGRGSKVPLMIGTAGLESAFLFFDSVPYVDDLRHFVPKEFNLDKNSDEALAIAAELKKLYFNGANVGAETQKEYLQLISDRDFVLPAHRYVDYLTNSSAAPVYVYQFNYYGGLNVMKKVLDSIGVKIATHADDLGYLYDLDDLKDAEVSADDQKTRDRMVRLWTNFAKVGNPTPEENHFLTVTWLPVTKDNHYYLDIDKELSLKTNPDSERMQLWDTLYSKYFKLWNIPSSNSDEHIIAFQSKAVHKEEEKVVEAVVENQNDSGITDEPDQLDSSVVEEKPELLNGVQVVLSNGNGVAEEHTEDEPQIVSEVEKVIEKIEDVIIEDKPEPVLSLREVKLATANGAAKDVIRANDPPEDDLPKNIGVNKFVNFFESLGGKK